MTEKEVHFGLLINEGVRLEDAVEKLSKAYKKVSVVNTVQAGRKRVVMCKSPQDTYERLSNTKLIEQTCEYTDKSTKQKKTHKYLTNDKEPTLSQKLSEYFVGVDRIDHDHSSDDLDNELMKKLGLK